jgi:hypothetical protein
MTVSLCSLRRILLFRPPCLHQCRQLLTSLSTHRLTTSGFLRGSLGLLRRRLPLLLRPPGLLCRSDSGTRCRAHTTTFLAACWFSLAPLGRTTTMCRFGSHSHESCNCPFDTASFLPKLCHYALNIHVVLSLIATSNPVVQQLDIIDYSDLEVKLVLLRPARLSIIDRVSRTGTRSIGNSL